MADFDISRWATIFEELLWGNTQSVLARFRRKYEGDVFPGNVVKIKTYTAPTVQTLSDRTGDLTYSNAAFSTSDLTVDQFRYIGELFYDINQMFSNTADEAQAIRNYVSALISNTLTNVLALAQSQAGTTLLGSTYGGGATTGITLVPYQILSTSDYTGAGVTGSLYTLSLFAKAKLVLDKLDVPDTGRIAIVPPEVSAAVVKTATITEAADPIRSIALTRGAMDVVSGFDVYPSNNLPTSNSLPYALFMHESAVDVAGQIKPPETFRHTTKFGDVARILNVFGRKATHTTRIVAAHIAI